MAFSQVGLSPRAAIPKQFSAAALGLTCKSEQPCLTTENRKPKTENRLYASACRWWRPHQPRPVQISPGRPQGPVDRTAAGLSGAARSEAALPEPSRGRSSPPTGWRPKAATGPAAKRTAAPSWKRPWPWGPTSWTWNWPRTPPGAGSFGQRRGEAKLILSWHDFSGTPDTARLEAILQKMLAPGGRHH